MQDAVSVCKAPAKASATHVLYCSSYCFVCVRSSPKVALLSIHVTMRQPSPCGCARLSLTAIGTCGSIGRGSLLLMRTDTSNKTRLRKLSHSY
eukprot:354079-Pelagomonas_calceolata.AAC.2